MTPERKNLENKMKEMKIQMENLEKILDSPDFKQKLILNGVVNAIDDKRAWGEGAGTVYLVYHEFPAGDIKTVTTDWNSHGYDYVPDDRLIKDIILEAVYRQPDTYDECEVRKYSNEEFQQEIKHGFTTHSDEDDKAIKIFVTSSVFVPWQEFAGFWEKLEEFVGDPAIFFPVRASEKRVADLSELYLEALRKFGEGKVYFHAYQGSDNAQEPQTSFSYDLLTGRYSDLENLKKLDLSRLKDNSRDEA